VIRGIQHLKAGVGGIEISKEGAPLNRPQLDGLGLSQAAIDALVE